MRVEANLEKEMIFNTLAHQLQSEREKARELVANTDYILWLENFTKFHPKFTDDLNEHYPDELSAEDSQNISNMYLFFQGIDEYANKNFISSKIEDIYFPNEYYVIAYNNIFYQIGLVSGQGTFAYCDRIKSSSHFINFNDIISNKPAENLELINQKLNELCKLVQSLHSLSVPSEIIIKTVEKAFDTSDNK